MTDLYASRSLPIVPLMTLNEMTAAVQLQETYWGTGAGAIIPAHMLFSIAANGGHVLAAKDGERVVGVLIGFLGMNPHLADQNPHTNFHLYSKRMVVNPDYRNHGLGASLKLAQREFARERGIELVAWTFDPLLSRNAYLNVHKLGGICRTYYYDFYGTDNVGGLSPYGSSDRFYVEWWVDDERVAERAAGYVPQPSLTDYQKRGAVVLNQTTVNAAGDAVPVDAPLPDVDGLALYEVPMNYEALGERDPDLAHAWRTHSRAVIGEIIGRGYALTDVLRAVAGGRERVYYVLSVYEREPNNGE